MFISSCYGSERTSVALKAVPSILFYWYMTSETDAGGMAVEV